MLRNQLLRTGLMLAGLALLVGYQRDARAGVDASDAFDITIRGVSQTNTSNRFRFTGTGTMFVDRASGAFDFNIDLSNGLTFSTSSQGNSVVTNRNRVYGLADIGSPGTAGSMIFVGKVRKNSTRIGGKVFVAIPNRLGPPPDGFVYTTGRIKGVANPGLLSR